MIYGTAAVETCQAHTGADPRSGDPVLLCQECARVMARRYFGQPITREQLKERQRELAEAVGPASA